MLHNYKKNKKKQSEPAFNDFLMFPVKLIICYYIINNTSVLREASKHVFMAKTQIRERKKKSYSHTYKQEGGEGSFLRQEDLK